MSINVSGDPSLSSEDGSIKESTYYLSSFIGEDNTGNPGLDY